MTDLARRVAGNESIYAHMPALPNTERAVLGLDIVGRIPVGVKHHDFIGSREIETQTTSARERRMTNVSLVRLNLSHAAWRCDGGVLWSSR